MSHQEEGPETRLVAHLPKKTRQQVPEAHQEYCHIDRPEIIGQSWPNIEHVVLHRRFSGQRDKLDEQSAQSAGWVPTDECSTSKSRTIASRGAGTNSSNECTEYAIPDTDQVQYLRAQLAHRDAQLEHVRSERDTHFVQEEELIAHMRLHSSEAKDWKPRVVSEAEQVLIKESAEAARKATEKKPGTNSFKPDGDKQKHNSGYM